MKTEDENDVATGSVCGIVYTDTGAAGVYTVTETDAAGIDLGTTHFVVNAGHPRESDLRIDPNLASALATASGSGVMAPREERVDLWPLLALVALLVIAVEWIAALWPAVGRRRSGRFQEVRRDVPRLGASRCAVAAGAGAALRANGHLAGDPPWPAAAGGTCGGWPSSRCSRSGWLSR